MDNDIKHVHVGQAIDKRRNELGLSKSELGRRNVERWKRQGKVVSYKRPGKVEYRTADLRLLQRTTQDYFDESQPKMAEKSVKKGK